MGEKDGTLRFGSKPKIGGYYEGALASAKAKDGDESTRSGHLAATIEHLRSLSSLEGVRVEDDGIRVLVLVGDVGKRGVLALEWLAKVDPKDTLP